MPYRRALFDPLRYLREEVRAEVALDPDCGVRTRLPRESDTPQRRRQVQWILDHYADLLALQIEHNGASVQKLLAQGHLELRTGEDGSKRYIRK